MEFLDQAGFKVAKWDDLASTQEISVLRPSKTWDWFQMEKVQS